VQGGSGEIGKQLIKEVITELMDDLVENIHMPDIGCHGALSGDVSRSPIHWNNCQKDGDWSLCKQSWSQSRNIHKCWNVCECWNGKYGCCVWPRQHGWNISGLDVSKHLVLLKSTYVPSSIVGEVQSGSGCCDRDVDPQIEAGAILGDSDERVCVSSHRAITASSSKSSMYR
jgi:hypothetical protein